MQFDRARQLAEQNGKKLVASTSGNRAYDLVCSRTGETDIIFQGQLNEMKEEDYLEFYLDGGRYSDDEYATAVHDLYEGDWWTKHRNTIEDGLFERL